MALYRREAWIDAPLTAVWAFHCDPTRLLDVTPSWLGLRLESVTPEPEPDPPGYQPGTEVTLSVKPFGFGPRHRWTARITNAQAGDDHASFTDEMIDGPLPEWRHRHRFARHQGGTKILDSVQYALPIARGGLGAALATPVLDRVFAFRHRQTSAILTSESTST